MRYMDIYHELSGVCSAPVMMTTMEVRKISINIIMLCWRINVNGLYAYTAVFFFFCLSIYVKGFFCKGHILFFLPCTRIIAVLCCGRPSLLFVKCQCWTFKCHVVVKVVLIVVRLCPSSSYSSSSIPRIVDI